MNSQIKVTTVREVNEVDELIKDLTDRQFDVLTCLMFNVTSKAIGNTLHIHYRTVQGHFQVICKKLRVHHKNDVIRLINSNGSGMLRQSLRDHFLELTEG